ncbi:MAG: hypothetical protein M5U26_17915 [Planctomycetota bacterium]|nr:hypothetical protein [Planctomycetota bacterium]
MGCAVSLALLWPGAGHAEEPAPTPPPAAEDGLQQQLQQHEAAQEKLREEIRVQAESHFQAGKRLYEAFEYEQARSELERAVQLDRGNAEAQTLLIQVNDVLGLRRDRIKSAVQRLHGAQKVAIQERLVELDNQIDWGNRFVKQAKEDVELTTGDRIRRLEQSLQAYERARELVKWMPPEIDVESQHHHVVTAIREANKAIAALKEQLFQEDRIASAELAEARKAEEKRAVQNKIDVMLDQARALFEHSEYQKAEIMAGKIIEMDPSNAEAHAIEATARDRKHIKLRSWIEEEDAHQSLLQDNRVNRMLIPHSEYIVYPSNWSEIAQRRSDTGKAHAEEPWKEEIRKKLARHVSFEFVDTPLEEALAFLNSLTKVNIILDPRVAAEDAGKVAITLRVADMDMQTALKWILRLAELDFDLRNQAVFITKKANLTANVELEIYDVRDLTTTVTDFPGPRIEVGVAGSNAPVNPFAQQAAGGNTLGAPDLAQLIQERLLAADFADPATSIQESGGKLVVMQRPEVHEKIRELLRSFRETQTVQVLTQVRFIEVQEGFLEMIGVHFTGLDSPIGDAGVPFARVDPLNQPSRYGLFPIGGGPGLTPPLPSDILSSPAFQFQDSVDPATGLFRPPFHFDVGPPSSNPGPRVPLLLRPRLDSNFPTRGNATFGPANAPAGFRRQWYEKAFGSPTLIQGLVQNFVTTLGGAGPLGQALTGAPFANQGAIFQFRFFHSFQAAAVLQALRKDQSADTLLAPKLMQFNNQRAHVMVAQQRSYIADYDVSGAVFDPVIRSFLIGVVLDVKPTVSHDRKYVTLDVRPGTAIELTPPQILFISNGLDVNNPLGNINLPIELPNIELRSINTTVTVPDNGTLLFSGLINDRKIDSKSGMPFFSDLPIVGRLFSNNLKQRERRNLLILVNARIVLFDEEEEKL